MWNYILIYITTIVYFKEYVSVVLFINQ
jgi:hypothetical protein